MIFDLVLFTELLLQLMQLFEELHPVYSPLLTTEKSIKELNYSLLSLGSRLPSLLLDLKSLISLLLLHSLPLKLNLILVSITSTLYSKVALSLQLLYSPISPPLNLLPQAPWCLISRIFRF